MELSGAYRIAEDPAHPVIAPVARWLAAVEPERILGVRKWGSRIESGPARLLACHFFCRVLPSPWRFRLRIGYTCSKQWGR
jgi:hypothetical protein